MSVCSIHFINIVLVEGATASTIVGFLVVFGDTGISWIDAELLDDALEAMAVHENVNGVDVRHSKGVSIHVAKTFRSSPQGVMTNVIYEDYRPWDGIYMYGPKREKGTFLKDKYDIEFNKIVGIFG